MFGTATQEISEMSLVCKQLKKIIIHNSTSTFVMLWFKLILLKQVLMFLTYNAYWGEINAYRNTCNC
jgi:hypothetical protein